MNKTGMPKRHFLLKLFTSITIVAYLMGVVGYYISPIVWWPLGLASIAFAYLWVTIAVVGLFWWRKKQRIISAICMGLLLAGFQPALVTFSIGWDKAYVAEKQPGALRVMQWNCMELPGNHRGWKKFMDERKAAETFLLQFKPDIICMEDFGEQIGQKLESNHAFLEDTLEYQYKIFAESSSIEQVFGTTIVGTIIYSKQPLIRSGILPFANRKYPEYIVWADVLHEGKPVRIVTTHFRSMNLFIAKTTEDRKLPYFLQEDSIIVTGKNIFSKIIYYQEEHVVQAGQLRAFIDTCSVPVVLCTDMNTVPASFTYKKVRGKLHDGFAGSKTGLGNTYNFLLPNLRIDYLFNDPALEAKQWKHFTNGFFDHDHLMADFSWKKD